MQDWRHKVDVKSDIDSTIRRILDQGLPEEPYTFDVFSSKVQMVFDHVLTAYGNDGESAYDAYREQTRRSKPDIAWPLDVDTLSDDVVSRIHDDPDFAAHVASELGAIDS